MRNRTRVFGILIVSMVIVGAFFVLHYDKAHYPLKTLYLAAKKWDYAKLESMNNVNVIYNREMIEEYGEFLWLRYDNESVWENCEVVLYLTPEPCSILGRLCLDEERIIRLIVNINYYPESDKIIFFPIWIYNEETKKEYTDSNDVIAYMGKYNISEDAVKEFQHYILYDVVAQRWVSRDNKERIATEEDFKMITFEDHTFDFDWRGTE